MPNYTGSWTRAQQMQAIAANTWSGLPLFAFTTYTFNNASATGQNGPTLSACQAAYAGQPWLSEYFTVSPQGFQQWTVPTTGNYTIEVAGAPGGGTTNGQSARVTAGRGRDISQTIALNQGDVLVMVIGQIGARGTYAGGGGGGTFVIRSGSVLIAAGGGGGDGYYYGSYDQRGQDAQDVLSGNPSTGGAGGTGQGGGGGGAFGGDGSDATGGANGGFGGKGYSNSFVGGNAYNSPTNGVGGFGGGGGSGGGTGANAGGGGGGYAGGRGCDGGSPFTLNSLGGSCYVATGSPTYIGYNTGQGFVTITAL